MVVAAAGDVNGTMSELIDAFHTKPSSVLCSRPGGSRFDSLRDDYCAPPMRGRNDHDTTLWEKQGNRDMRIERCVYCYVVRHYSSCSELFAGSNSGINFDKYEDIPVEATGKDVPEPTAAFSDLKLHAWVDENVKHSGYVRPTPVQKYAIPVRTP